MSGSSDQLDPHTHAEVFREAVRPKSRLDGLVSHERPKAIILGGQPGSGKGGLERAAQAELHRDVITIDPDQLRRFHPRVDEFRAANPYTWSGRTHGDASAWASELREAAVAGRKNVIIDTTLGNGDGASKLIKDLQSKGYDVEVRVVAAHRLESERGVDSRFSESLDRKGYGRYVPKEVRDPVYDHLPGSLDTIRAQTDAPIRIFGREGRELYDSRTDPHPPGQALERARDARLADPKITRGLSRDWQQQRDWHANLPEEIAHNPKVTPEVGQRVLAERSSLGVVEGVERNAGVAADAASAAGLRSAVGKGLGIAGGAALAYDAYRTTRQYEALSAKGNQFGADALLHRYEGRTAGGLLVGAAAGAGYGLIAGSETGPGALVTGAVGGVIGAFGGEKLATLYNTHQVNHQAGTDGTTYAYADGRWTTTEHHVDWHRYASGTLPGIAATTSPAPAAQLPTLDYKRGTAVTELALANPPTQDTTHIRLDGSDWRAAHGGGWTRDALLTTASGLSQPDGWGGVVSTRQAADAPTGAHLNQIAAGRQYDNDHYGQAVAQAYVMDYYGKGWNRSGPLPDAVTSELRRPSETRVKDPVTGHTWTADGKGGFSRGEAVVAYDTAVIVPVRASGDEQARIGRLQHEAVQSNAVYGSRLVAEGYARSQGQVETQAAAPHAAPHAPKPARADQPAAPPPPTHAAQLQHIATAMRDGDAAALHRAAEPFTGSARGQALLEQSTADARREEQHGVRQAVARPTGDARDVGHPDHALDQSIRKQVETLHTRAGIYPTDGMIDHLTAAVALDARKQGLTRMDQMEFNADRSAIVVGQAGRETFGKRGGVNVQESMQVSPEQHYQRMADVSQERLAAQVASQQQVAQPRQGLSLAR